MTHGEDLASEMHQDSIVLTYLEGLLMHQAAEDSGSVDDKKSTSNAEDQNFDVSGNVSPSCQRDGVAKTHMYRSSSMLHHKKARLLQSSEDWNAVKKTRLSDPLVDLNVKNDAMLADMVENVPKGKQDSTLLASLLQSFSSRLQSVALSQQIRQSLKEQEYSLSHDSLQVEKDLRCYGVASSHLKTLLKKSKSKDEKLETGLPELTTNLVKDRFIESSHSVQNAPKLMNESLSCAARLQAVASMVEKRSSPATSPKPSVACSQLALLLSSEAHLQQYSREHALKAQNPSQIASERLSAIARLKESVPKDNGLFKLSKGMESHLNGEARCSTKTITNKSNMTDFQSHMGTIHSSHKSINYKTVEKSHLKPPTNSSLLLQLLKNHSATKQTKKYEQNDRPSIFKESSTPTTIDEYSDNNPSFTEDSSDDESSHSNCLPIDLSLKQKIHKPDSGQSTTLDNITQSLIHNWESKVPCLENIEDKYPSKNVKLNPHQKVTLLQLLLGHKNEDDIAKIKETEETLIPVDVTKLNLSVSNRTPVTNCSNANQIMPVHTPPLLTSEKSDSPINLSHSCPLVIKHNSPPYTCMIHPERLINPASKHLIDLTVHKELQGNKQNKKETLQSSSPFSASKLLQNLAQCGMQSSGSIDDQRQANKQITMTLNTDKPVGLIDGLNSSLLCNTSCTLDECKMPISQLLPAEQKLPSSEIQNLLERRTVLQLLLGTSNKNSETKEKMFLKEESLQDQAEKVLDEQILTVKIKAEPSDETSSLQNSNAQQIMGNVHKKCPGMGHSVERNIAIFPAPEEFKSHSFIPEDFSFSKNGLLSRLLRQNQDSCSVDNLGRNVRKNEQTFMESKSQSMLPKKRKLNSESSEGSLKILKSNKVSISNVTNNHRSSTDALYGRSIGHKEFKFARTDLELKYSSGYGSMSDSENRNWSRESNGFNVLKQLLLSENCEKDMSQHRNNLSVTDSKKESKRSLLHNDEGEICVSPVHKLMGNSGQQTNCSDHETFQYSVAMKSRASTPFSEHLGGTGSSKPEYDQFSACHVPSERGPIKWVIADSDKNEQERDSPRLTKTNPILYYMLQKGGSSINIQETQRKDVWSDTSFIENTSAATIKKELSHVAECNSSFPNVRNPYSNSNKVSFQHNVNGEVYGLLGKVLTIKKEPE